VYVAIVSQIKIINIIKPTNRGNINYNLKIVIRYLIRDNITFVFGQKCRLTIVSSLGFNRKSIVNFQPGFSQNQKINFG